MPKRNTHAAVNTFYACQELRVRLAQSLAEIGATGPGDLRAAGLHREATALATWEHVSRRFDAALTRNMFDYLALACAGEARHSKFAWSNGKFPAERSKAWSKAVKYDPRTMLPVLAECFFRGKWGGGGYGGPKWGLIATMAARYFEHTSSPVLFLDHVVDISHNGGLAFNKGYILGMPDSGYHTMLDAKATGSILASAVRLSDWREPCWPVSIADATLGLMAASLVMGFPYSLESDPYVPPVAWGAKPFTMAAPVGRVHSEAEAKARRDAAEAEWHAHCAANAAGAKTATQAPPQTVPYHVSKHGGGYAEIDVTDE